MGLGLGDYNNIAVDVDAIAGADFTTPTVLDFTIDAHATILDQLFGFSTAVNQPRPLEQRRKFDNLAADGDAAYHVGLHKRNEHGELGLIGLPRSLCSPCSLFASCFIRTPVPGPARRHSRCAVPAGSHLG